MKLQNPYLPPTPDEAVALAGGLRPGAVFWADPIAKAVDDYLLMERKALAWDKLVARADELAARATSYDIEPGYVLALNSRLVQSAPKCSTS